MKMQVRKLFVALSVALALVVGVLASTSSIASAHTLTNNQLRSNVRLIHVQKAVKTADAALKSFSANAQQTSCQWTPFSVPPAPWQEVLAFQSTINSNVIVLAQLESAGPPVLVYVSTTGLYGRYSGPGVVQVPGTFAAILFGYPNITDLVNQIVYARLCGSWNFIGVYSIN